MGVVLVYEKVSSDLGSGFVVAQYNDWRWDSLMKSRTVISVIVLIIILFLARSIYSDHNLKKIIGACILAQTQTSSIEEAKEICADKFK